MTDESKRVRAPSGVRRTGAGALVVALAVAPVAHAAPPQSEAATRYNRGVELAEQGAYDQARAEFQRAYELRPHHSVLYNLGQVSVAMDRPLAAMEYLQRYLREGGGAVAAERRRAVERQIGELDARVPRLEIAVEPAGAQVVLDGRAIGRSPLGTPVVVDVGAHRIEAARDGYAPSSTTLSVSNGTRERVLLQLYPLPSLDAAASLGWLRVGCDGHAGDVLLDDQIVARTPGDTTLTVPAGEHTVAFRRAAPAGDESPPQAVVVKAKATATAQCPWPPPPPLARDRVGLDATLDRRLGEDGRDEHPYRGGAYALWGVGGALAGTALGLALWNKNRLDDWDERNRAIDTDARVLGPTNPTIVSRTNANNDLQHSIHNMNIVTGALAVGAGLAAVAGTVLYFKRARIDSVALTPSGVLLGASF